MAYYKSVIDGIVQNVNTVNGGGVGNISAEEYTTIVGMFRSLPIGTAIRDNGDGTYTYVENPIPPDPDPEIDDAEAFEIIFGGAE